MTVAIKMKPIGRHPVYDIDDEPQQIKPLVTPSQRLSGLRLAGERRRLSRDEQDELAKLEREHDAAEAEQQRIAKRRELREQAAREDRHRAEYLEARAAMDSINEAIASCEDDEELAALFKRQYDARARLDLALSKQPAPRYRPSLETQLLETCSPEAKARLRLCESAVSFYRDRAATLRSTLIQGTPEEIADAEARLAAAETDYRAARAAAINEE